jgi:isoprenylcysteine carboxyl methyltransferase (ICMT) family protein YpbQ
MLVIFGGYLRMKARLQLGKKTRFNNFISTSRLQVVEGQQFVKNGLYRHIHHQLYLVETLENLSIASIFSSGYGILFLMIGTIFLLFRIKA